MKNPTCTHHETGERKNHQKLNLVWWEKLVYGCFFPQEVRPGRCQKARPWHRHAKRVQQAGYSKCSQWRWGLTADMTSQATRLSREVCGLFEAEIGEGWGNRLWGGELLAAGSSSCQSFRIGIFCPHSFLLEPASGQSGSSHWQHAHHAGPEWQLPEMAWTFPLLPLPANLNFDDFYFALDRRMCP